MTMTSPTRSCSSHQCRVYAWWRGHLYPLQWHRLMRASFICATCAQQPGLLWTTTWCSNPSYSVFPPDFGLVARNVYWGGGHGTVLNQGYKRIDQPENRGIPCFHPLGYTPHGSCRERCRRAWFLVSSTNHRTWRACAVRSTLQGPRIVVTIGPFAGSVSMHLSPTGLALCPLPTLDC